LIALEHDLYISIALTAEKKPSYIPRNNDSKLFSRDDDVKDGENIVSVAGALEWRIEWEG
jgi:hypothetical protein